MSVQSDFEDLIDALETNLQIKGVSDAQFDSATGVMGLVSRILDISYSSSSSISLTSNKSVLSKADGESAILTVTITNNGSGVTDELVLISRDDVVIGLATDNNDGTYTYEYESEGIGDISFTATNGSITSNAYTIEDIIKYDTASNDNRSKYTGTMSLSYNSNGYYIIPSNASNNQYVTYDLGGAITEPVEICADVYIPSTANVQPFFILIDNDWYGKGFRFRRAYSSICNQTFNGDSSSRTDYNNTTMTVSAKWYTIKCQITSTGIESKVYDGDTLVQTSTTSLSSNLNYIKGAVVVTNEENNEIYFKNIKIKPLHSISLTSDKSVLSYADSDTCTLTATYSKGCGEVVKLYNARNDGLIGIMTDNRDGTYSYEYTSQGIGDLTVYAKSGMLVSETFAIRDDLFADSMINSIKSAWSNNGFTLTSDANGTLLNDTSGQVNKLLYNINQSSFSVEFDYLTGSGDISFGFRVENSSNNYSSYLGYYSSRYRFGANAGSEKSITTSAPSNNHMKLEITPTSHKFYVDDVLIEEVSPSNSTTNQYIGFYLSGTAQFKVKNFEIKLL